MMESLFTNSIGREYRRARGSATVAPSVCSARQWSHSSQNLNDNRNITNINNNPTLNNHSNQVAANGECLQGRTHAGSVERPLTVVDRSATTSESLASSSGWQLVESRSSRRMRRRDERDLSAVVVWGVEDTTTPLEFVREAGPEVARHVVSACHEGKEYRRLVLVCRDQKVRETVVDRLNQSCPRGWRAVRGRTFRQRQLARAARGIPERKASQRDQDRKADPYRSWVAGLHNRFEPLGAPSLKFAAFNANSFSRNKAEEVVAFAAKHDLDIVAISEVGNGPGMNEFKSHCWVHEAKSKVGFLVAWHLWPFLQAVKSPNPIRAQWIRVSPGGGREKLYFCSAYGPQESDKAVDRKAFFHLLGKRIGELRNKGRVIVGGDLNARVGEPAAPNGSLAADGAVNNGPPVPSRIGWTVDRKVTENGKLLKKLLAEQDMFSLVGPRQRGVDAATYTRKDRRTSAETVIDYILGDRKTFERAQCVVEERNLCSDHRMVVASVDERIAGVEDAPAVKRWNRKHLTSKLIEGQINKKLADFHKLVEEKLGHVDLRVPETQEECDEMYSAWTQAVRDSAIETIGMKSIRKRRRETAWFDEEVKAAIEERRKLHLAFTASGTEADWKMFVSKRRSIAELCQRKKKESLAKVMSQVEGLLKPEPKRCWGIVNRMRAKKGKVVFPSVINPITQEMAVTWEDRSEAWAAHYERLGSFERKYDPVVVNGREMERFDEEFRVRVESEVADLASGHMSTEGDLNEEFTVYEVDEGVRTLKSGKAAGPDSFPNELWKAGRKPKKPAPMSEHLCRIFNVIWKSNFTPNSWRKGTVINLFKSGDATLPGNYRGITLLNTITKLYTKLINTRLSRHLEEGGLLTEVQCGFRPNRCCIDQIYVLHQLLQFRARLGKPTYCFFLDISKAFDTVWWGGLWKTLWELRVQGRMWQKIRELYRNASSSVLVDGKLSREFQLEMGVRQGDTLSPTLFAVFINELANIIDRLACGVRFDGAECGTIENLSMLMLADDMVFIAESIENLQKMIDEVGAFFRKWRLKENIKKSQLVVFQKKGVKVPNPLPVLRFLGAEVKRVDRYKYLGLIFHESLSWKFHMEKLKQSCSDAAKRMRWIFANQTLTIGFKRLLYTMLIRPKLEYGSEVWTLNTTFTKALESIQLKCARSILRCNSHAQSDAVRGLLGLWSLESRRGQAMLRWWARLGRMASPRWAKKVAMIKWRRKGKSRTRPWHTTAAKWLHMVLPDQTRAREILPPEKVPADPDSFWKYLVELDAKDESPKADSKKDPVLLMWAKMIQDSLEAVEEKRFLQAVQEKKTLRLLKSSQRKFGLSEHLKKSKSAGAQEVVIRLLLGGHGLCAFQSRMHSSKADLCPSCEQSPEDSNHLLVGCEAYRNERKRLLEAASPQSREEWKRKDDAERAGWIVSEEGAESVVKAKIAYVNSVWQKRNENMSRRNTSSARLDTHAVRLGARTARLAVSREGGSVEPICQQLPRELRNLPVQQQGRSLRPTRDIDNP